MVPIQRYNFILDNKSKGIKKVYTNRGFNVIMQY